jgi:regulator of sigma E protease
MLAAKLFGCYVTEFALGFGPTILKKQGKETVYSLRAVPLGGFTGMVEKENTPTKFDENGNPVEFLTVPKERTLYGIDTWKRIIIFLAGPFMNMVLACAVFIMVFQINGYIVDSPKPIIAAVTENSPARDAGILPGDEITKVTLKNGENFVPDTFQDVVIRISNYNDEITFTVNRNGQNIDIRVTPKYNEELGRYVIGVSSVDPQVRELNFFTAIPEGIKYAFMVIDLTFDAIIGLFTGTTGLDSLGGTISMYKYTEEAASYGFISLLSLVGSLSVSVGVMNLIPISIFDGGRVVQAIVEKIIGHRLSEKAEAVLTIAGLVVVVLLFLFVTYQDIIKLF